ncbi:hypothetical protein BSU04_08065 [Caballeronia sordidicola]|uniref:Uncharacterized protein n=1 Tax=Caballeronia sordidicola TaxID=196367 RepID=A0A226X710_CABSO|nr:hypothetical protein BSU04_08065 [Caballeronia sordidicola]
MQRGVKTPRCVLWLLPLHVYRVHAVRVISRRPPSFRQNPLRRFRSRNHLVS